MPLIQLNFNNPLNTSVQIGDVAYFSNPIPVGNFQQWTATSTPHLTNDQQDIIKIGVIVNIIPWNGAVSIIECDMPQALFNKYFMQIVAGGCVEDPTSPPLTNSCAGLTIYETQEDLLTVAFSPGNHNTFYQDIGVYGTSTATGNAAWSTGNTCDGMRIVFAFYNNTASQLPQHTGGLSAAQTLDHWINDHGVTTLNAGSNYADFMAVFNSGQAFGHGNPTAAPCQCTYPEICTQGSFIMFSKDNKVNTSSMLGYYASAEFRNNSPTASEIFDVGADVFLSSK